MGIAKFHRSLKIPEALLLYLSTIIIWELIFLPFESRFDNIGLLAWSGSAITIYGIARMSSKSNFFGCTLKVSEIPEIFYISIATVLIGIGSWSLLVYSTALLSGERAMEHWNLISGQDFKKLRWSTSWLIGQLIILSFLVPLIEEIIFRGFILHRLRERFNPLFSVGVSAGLFAVFHYNKNFFGAFVHGIIFGVLALRTSSIYAPILVHCLHNLTIFVLTIFFGLSIAADKKMLSIFTYWMPELILGIVGILLLTAYSHIFPSWRRSEKTQNSVLNDEI